MLKVALITPTDISVSSNPGWFSITGGIKYILEQAYGKCSYNLIDMCRNVDIQWATLKCSDVVIICGNPRFNMSEKSSYEDLGIWQNLICSRIPIIDAWNGNAHEWSEKSLKIIEHGINSIHKTSALINYTRLCKLVITRDEILYNILSKAKVNVIFEYCSSWWSAKYYRIQEKSKEYNIIIFCNMPGNEWMIDSFLKYYEKLKPCRLIATNIHDWRWFRNFNKTKVLELISDPIELLDIYSRTDSLISMRIHSSIPAMSLGAKVCSVYHDTRYLTCSKFGINSIPFMDLKKDDFKLIFEKPTNIPILENVVKIFKDLALIKL